MADPLASSGVAQIQQLIAELRAANQRHMTSHSGDAAYHAGAGMAFAEAAQKVAALLAVDAPQHEEEKDDLSRVATGATMPSAGSTANTATGDR